MTEQQRLLARQQAASWVLLLDIEQSTDPADYQAFIEWVRLAPEHDRLYEHCRLAWQESGQLPATEYVEHAPYHAQVIEFTASTKAAGTHGNKRHTWLGLCASVFLLVGLMLWTLLPGTPQYSPYFVSTQVGEQRALQLEDGSRLTLNTDTALSVRYSDKQRLIVVEHGEVLVDVAKNSNWPFLVSTPVGQVEALGTKFTLRADAEHTQVNLIEGHLRVSQPNKGRVLGELFGGEAVDLVSGPEFNKHSVPTLQDPPDWLRGKLSFNDVSLAELVAEVNRYLPQKVYLSAPELGRLRVSAVFEPTNVDGLFSALERGFQLKIQRTAAGIYLSR